MNLILSRIEECKEQKFLDKGRNPKVGLDCAGLIIYCLKDLIEIKYGFNHYNVNNAQNEILEVLNEYFYIVNKNDLKIGDVVAFKFNNNVKHLALIKKIENDIITIIHVQQKDNKVIEHHLNNFFKDSIYNFYRLKILKDKNE